MTPMVTLVAVTHMLAVGVDARAQDTAGVVFVDPGIDEAMADSEDGWAYVIVRLANSVDRDAVRAYVWAEQLYERQQEVLDAFADGEFELTHRPPAGGRAGSGGTVALTEPGDRV